MSKTRSWLLFLGGLCALVALAGFYIVHVRGAGHFGDPVLDWPIPIQHFLVNWYWFLALGLLLVFLGNGTHQASRWSQFIDGYRPKSLALYDSVAGRLVQREVPDHSTNDVSIRQGGLISAKRRHLRVSRGYFRFDLYAAPFGVGLGVAWRCYYRVPFPQQVLLSLPVLGWVFYYLFFRYTTYVEDQGLLFQRVVHQCVREALDEAIAEKGLRALSEDEYKPILMDMDRRWR